MFALSGHGVVRSGAIGPWTRSSPRSSRWSSGPTCGCAPPRPRYRIWPTGFPLLDESIGGGFRAGALNVLAGPQGQGKSTMALQMSRNAAVVRLLGGDLLLRARGRVAAAAADLARGRAEFGPQRAADLARSARPSRARGERGRSARAARVRRPDGDRRADGDRHSTPTGWSSTARRRATPASPRWSEAVEEVYADTGQPPLVVVDYLQKVSRDRTHVRGGADHPHHPAAQGPRHRLRQPRPGPLGGRP